MDSGGDFDGLPGGVVWQRVVILVVAVAEPDGDPTFYRMGRRGVEKVTALLEPGPVPEVADLDHPWSPVFGCFVDGAPGMFDTGMPVSAEQDM